jgi:Arc/MetJ-type ribon-helix-helix transcriptional regulator
LVERDKYRSEVKEVVKALKRLQDDKEKLISVLKEKMNSLDTELKSAEGDAKKWQDDFIKADKQVKSL